MAAHYTTNYQLCQWEATDKVLRTDFNQDNQKIDAALAGKAESEDLATLAAATPKVAAGSYTGDGSTTRLFELGFTPKAVLVLTNGGQTYYRDSANHYYGGLAATGAPVVGQQNYSVVEVVEVGFQVSCRVQAYSLFIQSNVSGMKYHYFAIG